MAAKVRPNRSPGIGEGRQSTQLSRSRGCCERQVWGITRRCGRPRHATALESRAALQTEYQPWDYHLSAVAGQCEAALRVAALQGLLVASPGYRAESVSAATADSDRSR